MHDGLSWVEWSVNVPVSQFCIPCGVGWLGLKDEPCWNCGRGYLARQSRAHGSDGPEVHER
jgi:hypothetical protein